MCINKKMLRGVVLLLCAVCVSSAGRYAFFRSLDRAEGTRRLFGGFDAAAGAWPGACALLNRAMVSRCSCSVVAPRWALTAAHCVKPDIAYVQFNGHDRSDSNIATVKLLYSHPAFEVVVKDMGAGPDVITLAHDVGLVFTRGEMLLSSYSYFPVPHSARSSKENIVESLLLYNVDNLLNSDIEVLGFGATETKPAGERLREVHLRLTTCGREGWRHCTCALGTASGVCSGDSGGPVLYNGTQIGVMSMGPVECGSPSPLGLNAPAHALSVFTTLRPYASLINSTMHGIESALRMRELLADNRARTLHATSISLLSPYLLSCPAVALFFCSISFRFWYVTQFFYLQVLL